MEINIITHPRFKIQRALSLLLMQVGLVLLGVLAGSNALQWSGFIGGWIILTIIGADLVKQDLKENTHLTIAQARKRLDVIEAQESKHYK